LAPVQQAVFVICEYEARQRGSVNQFNSPPWIFVTAAGQIYVTDQMNTRIVRMNDMIGAGWVTLGPFGIGVGQFNVPGGIAVH
jgi:hypothetical protein